MTVATFFGRHLKTDPAQQPVSTPPIKPELQLWGEDACSTRHGIAIAVPLSGSLGIFGPSCIAGAQLAVAEVNDRTGVNGRQLDAIFLNSDPDSANQLASEIDFLIGQNAISAVVLMSYSEVRELLKKAVRGRVPLVYTPPFDGNEFSPNVFTIGSTPYEQFIPAVWRMSGMFGVRRWALVGKNNVWPHPSSYIARKVIRDTGGSIVYEEHVLPGRLRAMAIIDRLIELKPDIVYMSLAGQDSVIFNRLFGEAQLDRQMLRFTELTEESILLGSGPENTNGLYSVASYFTSINSDTNLSFQERYRAMHGPIAPVMNMGGQSVYEGVQFYAALMDHRRRGQKGPIAYQSARGGVFHSNQKKEDPVFLAEADATRFRLIGKV